jgi:hypothetical protein
VISLSCEQKIDFYINQPVLQVFGYLSKLPEIATFKVDFVDPQNFQIHLSEGVTFKSWGESMTISFFDPMDGGTRLIVSSKPKLTTTLVDYGKNRKNVEAIVQYINSLYRSY